MQFVLTEEELNNLVKRCENFEFLGGVEEMY